MSSICEVLVLADDLSGAADCAVAWTRAGERPSVLLDPADMPLTRIVAMDLDSRVLPPERAGAAAARAVDLCDSGETAIVFQKMDSVLRGNWVAELRALRRALARRLGVAPLAVVAPALPSGSRATRGGRVVIRGEPLEETVIWKDAGTAGPADLLAMLRRGGLKTEASEPAADLDARFRVLLASEADAVVCDAETERDLAVVAKASLRLGRRCLWVGSAGLMHALVSVMGAPPRVALRSAPQAGGPVLTVVGSRSGVSRRQFEALAAEPGLFAREIPAVELLPETAAVERQVGSALDYALAEGRDVVLGIEPGSAIAAVDGPRMTRRLAGLVAPRLPSFGGLVMTGGETARAVLTTAGLCRLELLGEVEAGVPLGLTAGELSIPVITKSGSLGGDRTLVRCRRMLRAGTVESGESDARGRASQR